jgi:hypothetical protein
VGDGVSDSCFDGTIGSSNKALQPIAARWAAPAELFVGLEVMQQIQAGVSLAETITLATASLLTIIMVMMTMMTISVR